MQTSRFRRAWPHGHWRHQCASSPMFESAPGASGHEPPTARFRGMSGADWASPHNTSAGRAYLRSTEWDSVSVCARAAAANRAASVRLAAKAKCHNNLFDTALFMPASRFAQSQRRGQSRQCPRRAEAGWRGGFFLSGRPGRRSLLPGRNMRARASGCHGPGGLFDSGFRRCVKLRQHIVHFRPGHG